MNATHMRIRLPAELKAWVSDRAANNLRSMNAEIITLLKAAQGDERKNKQASKSKVQPA